jgi:hypothetical protein
MRPIPKKEKPSLGEQKATGFASFDYVFVQAPNGCKRERAGRENKKEKGGLTKSVVGHFADPPEETAKGRTTSSLLFALQEKKKRRRDQQEHTREIGGEGKEEGEEEGRGEF